MDSLSAAFCIIPLLFAVPVRVERPLPRRIPAIVPGIVLTALHDANAASDARRFEGALAVAKFVAEVMPIGPQRNEFRRCILIYQDIGAYFNDDSLPGMHDRLNADYPGYDDYIAEFRVADAKGNVLYPTAETRKFLENLIRR